MRRIHVSLGIIVLIIAPVLASAQAPSATQARPATAPPTKETRTAPSPEIAEQHTAHAMEAAKALGDGALYAMLHQMPKGGDLHNHITGAGYAENYVRFAIEAGLCVDRASLQLSAPPCKDGQVEARQAATDMVLFRNMIDQWSMRGAPQSNRNGHDHFFDTFSKFGPATKGHIGDILTEVVQRAADGHVQYLELMTSPDEGGALGLGVQAGFDSDFDKMRKKMEPALPKLVEESKKNLNQWDARKNELLRCNDPNPSFRQPGCDVTVRQLYTVLRAFKPEQVFAQLLIAFELAKQDSRMVGLNMVQPEDWPVPMNDFRLHMKMVNYLKELYPQVHITLHAGELAPGIVPPDGLRHHIRESMETGHAERIGHGVDVLYEDDADGLLTEMARQNVMVEVCLTSNDGILGVKGKAHPLASYLKAGVPVALATDDEGVSRSEMTREYQKAVLEQNIDYPTLKKMARNSIEHSFLSGATLWSDTHRLAMVKECATTSVSKEPSAACRQFLEKNDKAREQWRLEKEFAEFESKY